MKLLHEKTEAGTKISANLENILKIRGKYRHRGEITQKSDIQSTVQYKTTHDSEYSDPSRNLRVLNQTSKESENDKPSQQPSVIRGSFTQIMVNPMQLQDHEFTAWLDRLVEARKN